MLEYIGLYNAPMSEENIIIYLQEQADSPRSRFLKFNESEEHKKYFLWDSYDQEILNVIKSKVGAYDEGIAIYLNSTINVAEHNLQYSKNMNKDKSVKFWETTIKVTKKVKELYEAYTKPNCFVFWFNNV